MRVGNMRVSLLCTLRFCLYFCYFHAAVLQSSSKPRHAFNYLPSPVTRLFAQIPSGTHPHSAQNRPSVPSLHSPCHHPQNNRLANSHQLPPFRKP